MQTLFEFAAKSDVEFGKLDVESGGKNLSAVTTTHEKKSTGSLVDLAFAFSGTGFTGIKQSHSHPNDVSVPSGHYGEEKNNPYSLTPIPGGEGDARNARQIRKLPGFQNIKFEVFNPKSKTITTYDGINRAQIKAAN